MSDSTQPILALYIVWHPKFLEGAQISESLRNHFRRNPYANIDGGAGLSVIFRCAPADWDVSPLPVDFNSASTTAIVALVDEEFVNDSNWSEYLRSLLSDVEAKETAAGFFPVFIDSHAIKSGIEVQAIRWDKWGDELPERQLRLARSLSYELSRMLRRYLEHLRRPGEEQAALDAYLQKVQIFLSHSKHDPDGQRTAESIRDWLHHAQGLSSFFDVKDIPAGVRFDKVILHQVRVSSVVAIHTDTYSSREWCRREIIEAKRWNVPLVVANCISDVEERGFPYMGNVPVVRMNPGDNSRIENVISRLLDEVLKDFIWRCKVELFSGLADSNVSFHPRQPELISLAGISGADQTLLVYPDPPLSSEEERLFEAVAPKVQLRSWNEWRAGAER